jgi:hypothetical protein
VVLPDLQALSGSFGNILFIDARCLWVQQQSLSVHVPVYPAQTHLCPHPKSHTWQLLHQRTLLFILFSFVSKVGSSLFACSFHQDEVPILSIEGPVPGVDGDDPLSSAWLDDAETELSPTEAELAAFPAVDETTTEVRVVAGEPGEEQSGDGSPSDDSCYLIQREPLCQYKTGVVQYVAGCCSRHVHKKLHCKLCTSMVAVKADEEAMGKAFYVLAHKVITVTLYYTLTFPVFHLEHSSSS